ncbi:MAG: LamG domain-containing protein [Chloroflexi bacterium]|nr:LamG domain-containing protein [Chloroflexota bacterium]
MVSLIVSVATKTNELTTNAASRTLIKVASWAGHRTVENQLARLGSTGLVLTRLKALWASSKTTVVVGTVIVAVIALGAIATLAFFKFSGNPILEKVVGGVILIVVVLVSLYSLINVLTSVVQVVQGLRALFGTAAAIATTLRGSSALAGTTRAAGVIGAVIQVAIVWGFFIYQMVDTKTSVFSPEFNAALAQAIAATILVITLAVLSATVVGLIIVGVIALIDVILTAICELGVDALRKVPGLGGACFTINAAATAVLAKILYAYDTMIDTTRTDLVTSAGPKITLADPTRGYVADNPISIGLGVTTTVVHKDPERQNWYHILPFIWLFSEDNIRGTTFQYSLTQGSSDVNAERHQMDNAWQVQKDHTFIASPMYRAQAYLNPQINNITLPAGINQSPTLYLNTGYALPAYECWSTGGLIRVCYVRTLGGHNSTKLDQLKLDILPPTLDQFMTLTDAGNGGLKLGWDAKFATLADADGDGLRTLARQGNDPNDATWDADGDGLSDSYELQWRSQGVPISPVSWDTDGDGLPDSQELQMGTNPASKDTDNDGLNDDAEVYHQVYTLDSASGMVVPTNAWSGGWSVVITGTQPTTVIVSSDPSSPDSDGDGLSDQAEKELATNADPTKRLDPDGRPYHPLIINKNPLLVQVAVNDADRIVKPGQALIYNTRVTNLGAPFVAGGLEVNAPAALGGSAQGTVNTYRLELDQTNVVTKTTNFVVANSTSQPVTINSFARARLTTANPVGWKWLPATAGTLGGFTNATPAWHTSVAPATFSRQDSYAVTALNRSPTQEPVLWHPVYKGDVRAWSYPAGVSNAFGARFPALRDASPTDVACDAFGRCFYVWSQYLTAVDPLATKVNVIMGTLTNQDPQPVQTPEFVLTQDNIFWSWDFHPVVATDGSTFLVAWERVTQRITTGQNPNLYFMSSQIVTRRFDANGNALGNEVALAATEVTPGLANPVRISYLNLDIAWVGDAYRVLWSQPNGSLQVADFTPTGASITGSQHTIATDVKTGEQAPPQLAYDPLSGRIIVAYLDNGNLADTILFQNRSDASGVLTNQQFALGSVGVAYYPAIHGWLLTWIPVNGGTTKLGYTLLNADGTPVSGLLAQVGAWSIQPNVLSGSSLACPAANSQPVLLLPFEELPGATSFADTSGWNANASCSGDGCPLAGITGAPGAPNSDYGVRFNGAQKLSVAIPGVRGSRFSLAFWLKTSAATGGDFGLLTADNWHALLRNGHVVYASNLVNLTSSTSVADGQWHHIALTQNEFSASIYVDGQPVAGPVDSSTASVSAPVNLTIGSFANNTGFLNGEIDHLVVYNTTLDQATVQAIKDRTLNSYCLATASASTAVNTLRLSLQAQDTRGGVIKSSAGLSLTLDANPPTSTITSLTEGSYVQGTPGLNQTLIIGGSAGDANGIQQVNVSVNGGDFQPANGGATWVYPLQIREGRYTIQSQAIDVAGNRESAPRTTTVLVDASAPQIATDFNENAALTPVVLAVGQWQVGLQGTVSDPQLAGNPGSGVQKVDVLLQSADLNAAGNGWQPATLQDTGWSVNYSLTSAPTLSGAYTVTVRASDQVGNIATVVRHITLDGVGPNAALSANDATRTSFGGGINPTVASRAAISTPLSINGTASDAGGVNAIDVAFVPIQRVRAISDTLLFLPFDESSDDRTYHDISPLHTDLSCEQQCVAGQPGKNDKSIHMIPGTAGPLVRQQTGEFDFTAQASFSVQSWLRTTQADGVILSKEDIKQVGYALLVQGGRAALRLNGLVVAQSDVVVNDNQWHQLVGVVDTSIGEARLYVDGTLVGKDAFSRDSFDPTRPNAPLVIGGQSAEKGFIGLIDSWFDDVGVFHAALSPFLVQALYRTGDIVRQTATLGQPGATTTTWQVTPPAGMEDQYQIDLRTTDNLGNPALQAAAWRGVVDRLAPRIVFAAQPTGARFNQGNGTTLYEIAYSYSAEDRYLSDTNFSGPCDGRSVPVRDFADDADVAGLFPDLTLRNRLSASCTVWENSLTPATTVNACDTLGSCTTATPTKATVAAEASSASWTNANASEPSALLLAPTTHSLIAVDVGQPLTVTVVAQAEATLRQVVILLDGEAVATLDFTQAAAIQTTQQLVLVKLPDFDPDKFEGEHTLVAQASDWAGNVQQTLFPVTVTLDTHDPTVDLLNDKLTSADGYGLGNSMMRLHGTATDAFGLAAVQISINDRPFSDVTFDERGDWRTALWLGDDPAGKDLKFTLRAIDRAGHRMTMNKTLLVDVPPLLTVLATTITAGPTNPSADTSATFSFSGVDAQGNGMSSFQCQLDGSTFTPCTSPQTYAGLAEGEHIFHVLSSDGQGGIDPSPAEWIWQIGPVAPPVTATQLYLPLVARDAMRTSEVQLAGSINLYLPIIENGR